MRRLRVPDDWDSQKVAEYIIEQTRTPGTDLHRAFVGYLRLIGQPEQATRRVEKGVGSLSRRGV